MTPRPFMDPNDILAIRKAKNWTQAQMAKHIGVSPRTILNYEQGNTRVPRGVQLSLDKHMKLIGK